MLVVEVLDLPIFTLYFPSVINRQFLIGNLPSLRRVPGVGKDVVLWDSSGPLSFSKPEPQTLDVRLRTETVTY